MDSSKGRCRTATQHALHRFRIHHAAATQEHLCHAANKARILPSELAMTLVGRLPQHADTEAVYRLAADHRGIFVVTLEDGAAVTYLRLGEAQRRFCDEQFWVAPPPEPEPPPGSHTPPTAGPPEPAAPSKPKKTRFADLPQVIPGTLIPSRLVSYHPVLLEVFRGRRGVWRAIVTGERTATDFCTRTWATTVRVAASGRVIEVRGRDEDGYEARLVV